MIGTKSTNYSSSGDPANSDANTRDIAICASVGASLRPDLIKSSINEKIYIDTRFNPIWFLGYNRLCHSS